jgi:hypothetical protein
LSSSFNSAATPRYDVLFARYENFQNGAQRPNPITGTDALGRYLPQLNFDVEHANDWIKKLSEKRSVSIPNVLLTEQQITPYIP